jgi:hypothetical protein
MPRRVVQGIVLVQFSPNGEPAELFDKLAQALDFIHRYDPKQFARLRERIPRIALVEAGGEVYDHGLRTYIADARTVRARTVGEVALAIVHEATHARIHRLGVRSAASTLDRVERMCIAQEVAFAERTPPGFGLLAIASAKFQHPWWSVDEERSRDRERAEGLGMPGFAIRLMRLLVGRR